MSRTVLALVLVAGSASVASAGGFVGLGIGTNLASSGDTNFSNDGGRSGRLEIGYKIGRLAIEGIGGRADVGRGLQYNSDPTWTSLGLAGKYNLPLGDHFEAFGRLGYQRTSVDIHDTNESFSGAGLFGGAGFEYRINAVVTGVSLYVDYTISHADLSGASRPGESYGMTSRFWTLGATLSL